jgi:MFS family permease
VTANAGPMTTGRRWASLAAICTAAGLVWLAFADFGVAIPTMADELPADLSGLQWANNAFSLVTGALVIAAGKFGDIFGRRRMLSLGIVLFSAFSVVAALAPDAGPKRRAASTGWGWRRSAWPSSRCSSRSPTARRWAGAIRWWPAC